MFILILKILICLLVSLIVNYILSKKKLLIDIPEFSTHKEKHDKIIPLSGGIFFILSIFTITYITGDNNKIILFLFPFLLIGIVADTIKNFSPKIRLIFQLFFIILLIQFLKLKVSSIDLLIFDNYLKNDFFNFFFVTFCIVTVLNGHNFMDGINGFVSGNFLGILLVLYIILNYSGIIIDSELNIKLENAIVICAIFFIFNIFGICFLGDNGIYVFSIYISYLVITFIENSNNQLSPLLAATLLWYPAIENLFSILRRLKKKKKISDPDKLHLHILIKQRISNMFENKVTKIQLNSFTGLIINFLLLPNFVLSIIWFNNSINLMILIIIQILIYILLYFNFSKYIKN